MKSKGFELSRAQRRRLLRTVRKTRDPHTRVRYMILNPKIGPDWMLPGTQRRVTTPGQNVKRYVAGATDATTDRLVWVTGDRKNSRLFVALLAKLLATYADKRVIHVILDNYCIHHSRQTQAWLAEHGDRLRLHFLPPCCPDDNRIERCVWRELHANVTRNHTCGSMGELMSEVVSHPRKGSGDFQISPSTACRRAFSLGHAAVSSFPRGAADAA